MLAVTYTDGTTQTLTQSISDWYTPQGYAGESRAVSLAYRNSPGGVTQNGPFNVLRVRVGHSALPSRFWP
jgi:hypothetical protein